MLLCVKTEVVLAVLTSEMNCVSVNWCLVNIVTSIDVVNNDYIIIV